jgi:hypothetical protein
LPFASFTIEDHQIEGVLVVVVVVVVTGDKLLMFDVLMIDEMMRLIGERGMG